MYIHQQTGTLQKSGVVTNRHRHLCELMMVGDLSRELDTKEPHEALLDRLARSAAEATPAIFSHIVTREQDGSYVCRAIYNGYGISESFQKNRIISPAAWPHFSGAFEDDSLTPINRVDPSLSHEERSALGLDVARRIWLFPMQTEAEKVGLLIIGENRNGSTSLAQKQVELVTRIAEQAAIAIQSARRNVNLEKSFIKIILALAEAIDAADPDAYNHCQRTANLAAALAHRLGYRDDEVEIIRLAGMLHDIGKLDISEEILRKPGPLTPAEWEVIKRHPMVGADILSPISSLARVSAIIRSHHEKFDGSGYPYGLKGEQIPLEARILSVADAYSVMINGRVYRDALTQSEAVAELKRCAGAHFDPRVVKELLILIQQGKVD